MLEFTFSKGREFGFVCLVCVIDLDTHKDSSKRFRNAYNNHQLLKIAGTC